MALQFECITDVRDGTHKLLVKDRVFHEIATYPYSKQPAVDKMQPVFHEAYKRHTTAGQTDWDAVKAEFQAAVDSAPNDSNARPPNDPLRPMRDALEGAMRGDFRAMNTIAEQLRPRRDPSDTRKEEISVQLRGRVQGSQGFTYDAVEMRLIREGQYEQVPGGYTGPVIAGSPVQPQYVGTGQGVFFARLVEANDGTFVYALQR